MICFGLLMYFCDLPSQPAVDSFCTAYQRIIQTSSDASEIKKLSRNVKTKVDRVEILYRCKCEHWNNPICAQVQ